MIGTFISIAVRAADRGATSRLIFECFDYLQRIALPLSTWASRETALMRINDGAAILPSDRDWADISALARIAAQARDLTGSTFEPLSLGLTGLWRQAREQGSIPDRYDLAHELRQLRRSRLIASDKYVAVDGAARFDADGVGPGYLVDLAVEFLRRRGITHARVDCSGDMRFAGDQMWETLVEDPDSELPLARVSLPGHCAVGTSGSYRSEWRVNGVTYHHLIDPRSARPGNGSRLVMVVAPTCALADALAIGFFFWDPPAALRAIEARPGHGILILDVKGKLWMSSAIARATTVLT